MSLTLLRGIGVFLLHLLIATIGIIFCSTLMFYALKPVVSALHFNRLVDHDYLLIMPFFPYQSTVGFSVGVWVTTRLHTRMSNLMAWVWAVPALWLGLLCAGAGAAWFQRFFWSMSAWDKKVQLISTLPFLT